MLFIANKYKNITYVLLDILILYIYINYIEYINIIYNINIIITNGNHRGHILQSCTLLIKLNKSMMWIIVTSLNK